MHHVLVLTALDGVGGHLQGQSPAAGLGHVHAEHHAHTSVLPSDVRLALPELDVWVTELEDAGAIDAAAGQKGSHLETKRNDKARQGKAHLEHIALFQITRIRRIFIHRSIHRRICPNVKPCRNEVDHSKVFLQHIINFTPKHPPHGWSFGFFESFPSSCYLIQHNIPLSCNINMDVDTLW